MEDQNEHSSIFLSSNAHHGVHPIPTNSFCHLYSFLLSCALFSITCCIHADRARSCLLLITGRTRYFLGTLCIFWLCVRMQFCYRACSNRDRLVERVSAWAELQTKGYDSSHCELSFHISICSGQGLSLSMLHVSSVQKSAINITS